MFCPKCGALLLPKLVNKKRVLSCSCGYIEKGSGSKVTIKEEIKKDVGQNIEVVERNDDESLPITEADCPKCGNNKARYWLIQTRAADEPETKFLKCTKCRHIWRDYS